MSRRDPTTYLGQARLSRSARASRHRFRSDQTRRAATADTNSSRPKIMTPTVEAWRAYHNGGCVEPADGKRGIGLPRPSAHADMVGGMPDNVTYPLTHAAVRRSRPRMT